MYTLKIHIGDGRYRYIPAEEVEAASSNYYLAADKKELDSQVYSFGDIVRFLEEPEFENPSSHPEKGYYYNLLRYVNSNSKSLEILVFTSVCYILNEEGKTIDTIPGGGGFRELNKVDKKE